MSRFWLGLLIVPFAAACSDSGSSPDATITPDAYDTARCLIQGNYPSLGNVTGTFGSNMGATTVTVTIDAGPPRDTFFVKLTPGRGAFSGGVAPGSYTIAGADAGYSTCGLCVHIIADINPGSGPSKFYFADSGSVMLTSTTQPVAGSATNVHLREVDINTGSFVANGCEARIDSVTFTTN